MRQLLAMAVALVLAAPLAAQEAEPLTLRPDWQVGQTSRYSFTTTREQVTTISLAGRSQTRTTGLQSEGEVTWRVDQARPDGTYLCTMTLDWMAVTLTGPDGQKVGADSRRGSGEPAPLHQLVKAMSGVPLKVTVNADGSIASAKGSDAMKAGVPDPGLIPEELDFIESASDLVTLPHAPVEVAVGGSWRSQFRWSHDLGHLQYNVTWRPTGVEEIDGVPLAGVVAEAAPKLEFDPGEMGLPPEANASARMSASSFEGQILYDLARDEAVARNVTESRTFDITLRFPQGAASQRLVETVKSQTMRIAEQ